MRGRTPSAPRVNKNLGVPRGAAEIADFVHTLYSKIGEKDGSVAPLGENWRATMATTPLPEPTNVPRLVERTAPKSQEEGETAPTAKQRVSNAVGKGHGNGTARTSSFASDESLRTALDALQAGTSQETRDGIAREMARARARWPYLMAQEREEAQATGGALTNTGNAGSLPRVANHANAVLSSLAQINLDNRPLEVKTAVEAIKVGQAVIPPSHPRIVP